MNKDRKHESRASFIRLSSVCRMTSEFLAAQVSQGLWAECGVMVMWPIVVEVKASYEWSTTHKNKTCTVTSTQTRNNRSLKTATQSEITTSPAAQLHMRPNMAAWTVTDPPAKEENAARFRWPLLLILVTSDIFYLTIRCYGSAGCVHCRIRSVWNYMWTRVLKDAVRMHSGLIQEESDRLQVEETQVTVKCVTVNNTRSQPLAQLQITQTSGELTHSYNCCLSRPVSLQGLNTHTVWCKGESV